MIFPLKGNENVKSAVLNAIAAHRIPHAILIEGDEGLGKRTLARFIAKAAVCTENDKPCGVCRGCHLSDAGSHPDISITAPEAGKKNIAVSQIRELRAQAFVKPHSAEHRVFIIEQAQRMNEQAQNALLKVLEEPPAGVIFILITPSRTAMLDTIISRCTLLSLSAPAAQDAFDAVEEATSASREEIASALKTAHNNVGKAIMLLQKTADDAAADTAREFLRLLFSGSEYEMLKLFIPLEKNRLAAEEFIRALQLQCAEELKKSESIVRARVLDTLYDQTKKYLELLKTNINLPLLFSTIVCKAKELL